MSPFHRKDGTFSLTKMGVVAGIAASIATCILAAPIAFNGIKTAVAPWTSLPEKVDELQKDVSDIKEVVTYTHSTNAPGYHPYRNTNQE